MIVQFAKCPCFADVLVPQFNPPFPHIGFKFGASGSAMREQYMRSGEGFLLVYSITDRDSFDSINAYHQQILRVKDTGSVPIVLVGNKCDLEDGRCVTKNGTSSHLSLPAVCITFPTSAVRVMWNWNVVEGRYICEELGCRFVETSAKLGLNVEETFLNVVRRIRDHNRVRAYCSSWGMCEPLIQCL